MAVMGISRNLWVVRCIVPALQERASRRQPIVGIFVQTTGKPDFVDMEARAVGQFDNGFVLFHMALHPMFILENSKNKRRARLE